MQLIHYGHKKFNPQRFNTIKNRYWCKPEGGFWASPIDSEYGWKNWCKSEDFRLSKLKTNFRFSITGRIYVIDSLKDLTRLPFTAPHSEYVFITGYPDFEKIALEYDAIHLTTNGEAETRYSTPNLYGWDCESVLILNPNIINQKSP